jgi:hypothetical protein
MGEDKNRRSVQLDLNHEPFQADWLSLERAERNSVTETLRKIRLLTWEQVYRDQGPKWEKITSATPPPGIDAIYSLRISQSRRAIAYRHENWMRFLAIASDHDSTYGKK